MFCMFMLACCVIKSIRGRYEVSPEHMPGNLGAEMPDENMTLRMIKAIYLGSDNIYIYIYTCIYSHL
jgi:hypothetical protein